jgi:uncharacterized FlaG/YvyC family protein
MASDAVPGSVPVSLVHGSQAPRQSSARAAGGNSVPQPGKGAAAPAKIAIPIGVSAPKDPSKEPAPPPIATNKASPQVLVEQLNKYLNDSGRPIQFRVDPASRGETIQEINPATGEVIGEFSTSQFPELARSLGISGVLVDSHA